MASALTVLLLEGSYTKPSISVSPGGVIPMRGNITIRCWHQRLGMRILLYKDGAGNYLTYTDPAGSEAEFPITSARREHGGSYTCRYSNRSVRAAYSEPSDPVQIIVAEPSYPKPNISLHPSEQVALGGAVTIRCECRCRGARFLLSKDGDLDARRSMEPAGDMAEFPIRNVNRRDAGSYSCQYSTKWDPPVWSEPSDPVELVVAGGTDPTQPGKAPAPTRPGTVGPEPRNPKPNISLHPSERVALGGAVTIRCECRCQGARIFLSKAGDPDALRSMDPVEDVAEFPIRNVSRGDAGSYSCRYSTKWDPPVWLEPSDPVELVVAGGSELPAPLDLTHTIITGMSVAAAGLFLLLVVFVCYRRTGGRKGPALRQSRQWAAAQALASQPQEPNPGAEELTYTELGRQALQAKPGGSAPAPEPVVYATINVSRGPDGQSPQGAGCPPPVSVT
ncbi:leukocyte immunoglobulin-like receptor subfamily B member 3 [Mauremys mutica]|uniref:leukocyte immunoglobulin-like receptor subfamily B member 3 n=1 Tax=Mauremys mutica TaxID=74926 RepID=UPI001D167CF3|nr:leukocyte immunoglobulin-like receptor subfamily B member 3 [Mauremys mutica]